MLRVTLDTNVIGDAERKRVEDACAGSAEIRHTTVTDRETEGTRFAGQKSTLIETGVYDESRYDEALYSSIPETLVLGEGRLDAAVLGGDESPSRFEAILTVIGGGSFPKASKREQLSPGERRQLRDAIILEAHARDRRDVLVTNDQRGFIRHGRREKLEALCSTRIMTVEEFCVYVTQAGEK
jgi:hypothetical protein